MTPNVNYFELVEDYCLDLLDEEARVEFEFELKLDEDLRNEVKLRKEVQSAIAELDVINLRDKLKNVASQSKTPETQEDSFELFTDFSDFQELHDELNVEDLISFYDSMPKVHVHQHKMTLKENIHHFYKKQAEASIEEEVNDFSEFELDEFEGLEEAILEKDIIEFRQTLNQVAKTIEPQFTVAEIDNYLNDELMGEELIEFKKELSHNSNLKDELMLHQELETAIKEGEIMNLRSQVSQIMETETSWNVNEQEIEEFIDGELSEEQLTEFMSDLEGNSDLIAEVELRRQINDVIGEKDIMSLREELNAAKESASVSKVRRIVPPVDNKLFKIIRTGAAVIVVLLGIGSLWNGGYLTSNMAYENFYESPQWASERSVSEDYSYLQKVQAEYIKNDYKGVMNLKTNAPEGIKQNPVFQFYTAASMQNIENFSAAVAGYSQVIKHGDNMFIEEAEWYRSLCYIKIGNKKQAKQELLAVVNRNGHYKQDAKAILRRYKYKLE